MQKFIKQAVLEEICGKSKAEVKWIAARYDAKGLSPDRMRPVMVPKPAARPAAAPTSAGEALAIGESSDRLRSEVSAPGEKKVPGLRCEVTSSSRETRPSLRSEVSGERPEFERKWKVEAVISDQVKAKLDRCKSLLSSKYPRGVDYDILFEELSEAFLERSDPKRKEERRDQRKAEKKRPAKTAPNTSSETSPSRHIPAKEKEQVWTRDKGRCAYVGTNGKRCNSTFSLQIDHFPIPFARGGPSKAGNLRLLCARHNRYTAERAFGCLPHGKHGKPAGAGVSNRLIPGSAKTLIPNTSL